MRLLLALGCLLSLSALAGAADRPRISFEIITQPGLPPTASQQWYQVLSGLGVIGLQIRSGSAGDRPAVEQTGGSAAPAFRVTGILGADNQLALPGETFSARDTARLRKWIDNLGTDGVEGVTAQRVAFGLTPSQLEQAHNDLQRPVTFSTRGLRADQAIVQLAKLLRGKIRPAPGAAAALGRVTLDDELQGLSAGTAMAAIARPGGYVVVPRATGGVVEYQLLPSVKGQPAWPVGWPPKQRAAEAVPVLFEVLNAEISEIPVSEALEAIQGRLALPFVFDRNAMALHGADPATAPAEVPAKRLSYSQVLSKVLFQAKLKYEVRVDEAERPFLWITTVKPVP